MKELVIGDCHDLIKSIETESIDFIYFNPPFGITANEWDTPLNFKELFPEMFSVRKATMSFLNIRKIYQTNGNGLLWKN